MTPGALAPKHRHPGGGRTQGGPDHDQDDRPQGVFSIAAHSGSPSQDSEGFTWNRGPEPPALS